MKRTKFVALALVVAIMLMGAGYAYWTEELKISNTVDTGVLDVVFADPAYVEPEDSYMAESLCDVDTADELNHSLVIELNEVYPGAVMPVKFNLENKGTLKAFVREFGYINSDGTSRTLAATDDENEILCTSLTVAGSSVNLPADATLEDAFDALNALNCNKGIALDVVNGVGDKVEVFMNLKVNPNATNDSFEENNEFTFYIGAGVYQYNHQ